MNNKYLEYIDIELRSWYSHASLLKYSGNCSMTSGRLWNYYRHEIDNVSDDASNNKSLKNKKKLLGKREVQLA